MKPHLDYNTYLIYKACGPAICHYCDIEKCLNVTGYNLMKEISKGFEDVPVIDLLWHEIKEKENLKHNQMYEVFWVYNSKEYDRVFNPNKETLEKMFIDVQQFIKENSETFLQKSRLIKVFLFKYRKHLITNVYLRWKG